MKTLLLVDVSLVFYREFYAHSELEHHGIPTGGVYGFIKSIANTIDDLLPTDTVLCTDTRPYLRENDFPKYKGDRKVDPKRREELKHNYKALKEILEATGMTFVGQKGLEADDLIAMYLRKFSHEYDRVVAASSDEDLFQLFYKNNFSMYKGLKKGLFTRSDFYEAHPYLTKVSQWNEVCALAGTHNALPGIHRVGTKTAAKILYSKAKESKKKEVMAEHGSMIKLNRKLVKLPYYNLPKRYWKRLSIPSIGEFDRRKVSSLLGDLGIQFWPYMETAFDWLQEQEEMR